MHVYILYSVLPLEAACDTHALQHVQLEVHVHVPQVAAGLRVVKELLCKS